jgi:hypothetical protein
VDIRERLSRQKPDRVDFLRDLSVSYERMGYLLRGLGQGEQARAYFQKDLEPQGMQHCYILSPGYRGLHLVVADFKGIRDGYHFRQGTHGFCRIGEHVADQPATSELAVFYTRFGG